MVEERGDEEWCNVYVTGLTSVDVVFVSAESGRDTATMRTMTTVMRPAGSSMSKSTMSREIYTPRGDERSERGERYEQVEYDDERENETRPLNVWFK